MLHANVNATPSILLNDMKLSLEELRMMSGVSVDESAAITAVVLMDVGVERNQSRWRWILEEFGGVLQSDETVLVVQGMPVWSVYAVTSNGGIVLIWNPDPIPTHHYYCVTIEQSDAKHKVWH